MKNMLDMLGSRAEDIESHVMPTEFYDVRAETTPKGPKTTMWLLMAMTYSLGVGVFALLVLQEVHVKSKVDTIETRDKSGENAETPGLFNFFTRESKGKLRCEMLNRASDEFEFSANATTKVRSDATYEYFLANVNELGNECDRDLAAAQPCVDSEPSHYGSRVTSASTFEGLSSPSGLAVDARGYVYTYETEEGQLTRYIPSTGTFEVVYDDVVDIAQTDNYALSAGPDNEIYVVCSSSSESNDMPSSRRRRRRLDFKESPNDDGGTRQCGLLRIDPDASSVTTLASYSRFSTPVDVAAAHNGHVFVADKDLGVLVYKENAVYNATRASSSPTSIAASASFLWILDSSRLLRCDLADATNCQTATTDLDDTSTGLASMAADAGVWIANRRPPRVGTYLSSTGVVHDPFVPASAIGTSEEITAIATHHAANAEDAVFFVADEEDTTLRLFHPTHGGNTTFSMLDVATRVAWLACDDAVVTSGIPTDFSDMIKYAKSKCERAGLGFRVDYTRLYFPTESHALNYSLIAAREACSVLDATAVLCEEVADQPPYKCTQQVSQRGLDALSTAIANAEFLFTILVFAAATILVQFRRVHDPSNSSSSTLEEEEEEEEETQRASHQGPAILVEARASDDRRDVLDIVADDPVALRALIDKLEDRATSYASAKPRAGQKRKPQRHRNTRLVNRANDLVRIAATKSTDSSTTAALCSPSCFDSPSPKRIHLGHTQGDGYGRG